MKTIIFLLLTVVTFNTFAQLGNIEGHLIYKEDSSEVLIASIWIKGTNRGDVTDIYGHFAIDSIAEGSYTLIVLHGPSTYDTINNVEVIADATTKLNVSLNSRDCQELSKICPIDGNEEDVIPIVIGLPNRRMIRKAEKGKIWLAGCLPLPCQRWHCKRHDHQY